MKYLSFGLFSFEDIPYSENGMDEFSLKWFIHFIPEVIDIHFDNVGAGFEIDVPHFFGDLYLGDGPALVEDKIFHKGKFLGGQFDLGSVPEKLLGQEIHFDS